MNRQCSLTVSSFLLCNDFQLRSTGEDCNGAHSGAVSMNNDGCLRSEAGRRAVILGPDTCAKDPFDAWCLEKFDDDNCECQSAGHFLATDPGVCYALPEGPKSYRFRVVCEDCPVVMDNADNFQGRMH